MHVRGANIGLAGWGVVNITVTDTDGNQQPVMSATLVRTNVCLFTIRACLRLISAMLCYYTRASTRPHTHTHTHMHTYMHMHSRMHTHAHTVTQLDTHNFTCAHSLQFYLTPVETLTFPLVVHCIRSCSLHGSLKLDLGSTWSMLRACNVCWPYNVCI